MAKQQIKKKDMQFLLLEGIHPIAKKQLKAQGLSVKLFSYLDDEKKLSFSSNITGLCIRSRTRITKNLLHSLSHSLRVVGAFCIGTDQIDLNTACRLGIPVFNAPYANTRSVAELTIGHIVALSRRTYWFSNNLHQRKWIKSSQGSHEVRGKALGILGYGHIGTQVGVLAESLGMKVLYYDIKKVLPMGNASAVKNLKELLLYSDIVSVHVPETPLTKNMLTAKEFKWMKKGSVFINTSRGSVVNIQDLKIALQKGHLSGAAIDVFPKEPLSSLEDSFKTPLQGMSKVILTPHIAGSTEEAQEKIARQVSDSLVKYIYFGVSEGSVNFPALTPPSLSHPKQYRRLVNIHHNVPGVLAQINGLVSKLRINIKTQQLATNAHIGYLVMDIEREAKQKLYQAIHQLKTSIRTFIL